MSRILFVAAAIAPSAALAHVGPHDLNATGTLQHAVPYTDHALALATALILPMVAATQIWRRHK